MKQLVVTAHLTTHRFVILENDIADAAYEALKTALNSRTPYGEGDQAITVDLGDSFASFKRDALSAVAIEDIESSDKVQLALAFRHELLEQKIAAQKALATPAIEAAE